MDKEGKNEEWVINRWQDLFPILPFSSLTDKLYEQTVNKTTSKKDHSMSTSLHTVGDVSWLWPFTSMINWDYFPFPFKSFHGQSESLEIVLDDTVSTSSHIATILI